MIAIKAPKTGLPLAQQDPKASEKGTHGETRLATSLEDIARAIYAYDGFTREAALQAFSHIKKRTK